LSEGEGLGDGLAEGLGDGLAEGLGEGLGDADAVDCRAVGVELADPSDVGAGVGLGANEVGPGLLTAAPECAADGDPTTTGDRPRRRRVVSGAASGRRDPERLAVRVGADTRRPGRGTGPSGWTASGRDNVALPKTSTEIRTPSTASAPTATSARARPARGLV